MYGPVCGDIIGSYYEVHCTKEYNFQLLTKDSTFTDDTVLTAAVCEAILYHPEPVKQIWEQEKRAREYALRYQQYFRRYPGAGFGSAFQTWAAGKTLRRQRSYGNGAAMRVIPIGWAYDTMQEVLLQADLSCRYTHWHPQAVRAAKAVAASVFLARKGSCKEEIKNYLQKKFHYDFSESLAQKRESFVFDSRAGYSVPPAIQAFLESENYEDAVRKAVSMGGDSDTMACIAGGLAEAYGENVPQEIKSACSLRLDSGLKNTLSRFEAFLNETKKENRGR